MTNNAKSQILSKNVSSSIGLEPPLRFPEFEGEYTKFKLGDICIKVQRKNQDSDAPIMMLSAGTGFIMQSEKYSRDNAGQSLAKYTILKRTELAYNHGASKQKPFGCCYMLTEEKARVPYVYHCFSIQNNTPQYIAILLNNQRIERQLKKLVSSSVRMDGLLNISFDDYMTVDLYLPDISEQQKIADFLSLVDERIEKQRQLVDALKKYKRGLLSAFFNKISSNNTLTLGEICNITTGKLDANAMVVGGKYRFYTCAREYFEIDTYAFDTDALLISGNGANVGYIHHYCGKFNAYQRTYVLDSFQENIMYIYYYLQANLHPRIDAEKKAGNTPYIVLSTLSDMLIKLPTKEMQDNIAKIFAILDKKITTENDVLERLNTQKQGLLQKMFI